MRGRGLDTLLRGSLVLTAPGGSPNVVGVIRTEGGTFNAYAQRLTIERGSVSFTGPVNNPRLDILALRTQSATESESDLKVGVTVTGPALNPRIRLYSVPEMSETDKLSWLVLGRGPTDLGTTEVGWSSRRHWRCWRWSGSRTSGCSDCRRRDDIGAVRASTRADPRAPVDNRRYERGSPRTSGHTDAGP